MHARPWDSAGPPPCGAETAVTFFSNSPVRFGLSPSALALVEGGGHPYSGWGSADLMVGGRACSPNRLCRPFSLGQQEEHPVRIKALLVPVALVFLFCTEGIAAAAQAPPPPAPPANDSILFLKLATDISQSHAKQSLAGYLAILIREKDYVSLGKDADMGPYIQSAIDHKETCVVLVMPVEQSGRTQVVFFRDFAATQYSELSGKVKVAKRLKTIDDNRVTIDGMVPDGREELLFSDVELSADDGTPVPAFQILSSGPRR